MLTMTTIALQPTSLAANAIPCSMKDAHQRLNQGVKLAGKKKTYLAVIATGISHERGLGARLLLLQMVLDGIARATILECADLLQVLALCHERDERPWAMPAALSSVYCIP